MRTWLPCSRFQWASLFLALSSVVIAGGGFVLTFFLEVSRQTELRIMCTLTLAIMPFAYRHLQALDDEERKTGQSREL